MNNSIKSSVNSKSDEIEQCLLKEKEQNTTKNILKPKEFLKNVSEFANEEFEDLSFSSTKGLYEENKLDSQIRPIYLSNHLEDRKEDSSSTLNPIVTFDSKDNDAKRLKFKQDMAKKFAGLYVLDFIQDEDIFEYFKSIIDDANQQIIKPDEDAYSEGLNTIFNGNSEYDELKTTQERDFSNKTHEQKLQSKDCSKFLYLVIENPNNKNEYYELGLKVVNIIHNFKH
jgi:hypothetical protein